MSLGNWLRPPRHLLVVFLVIVLLPSTLLVVSGWRLARQEELRAREQQQARMADLVIAELRQRVAGIDAQLRESRAERGLASDRDDFVFVVFDAGRATATPANRLLFYPRTVAGSKVPVTALAEARAQRRLGNVDAALSALHRASRTTDVSVAGVPIDVFARWAECDLLESAGRTGELKAKAASFRADLYAGKWQLSRTAFETQEEGIERWLGVTSQPSAVVTARMLSSAVEALWQRWQTTPASTVESGHELRTVDGADLTLLWHANATRLAVFVASSAFIDAEWLSALREGAARQQLSVALRHPGASLPAGNELRQVAGETGLPWTVAVAGVVPLEPKVWSGRFRIWIAGVALLSLIVVGGTFVIARAAARELAVARLQTDFVAAVSHEFRTPLTSLRQIGEVLHDGRIQSDEKRQTYYQAMMRQTERLHHLVETLLDFGRMEAGRSPYRKEPLDLASWARSVVGQFNGDVETRGYTVHITTGDDPVPVLVDGQALSNALWNLLDNAVKYSPDCRTVWVDVQRDGNRAELRVRDRGIGVSAGEQRNIFGKFVRGAEAKRQNIPGTGIGLAMVQHIMTAHGGSVRVDSTPGNGSTFTLILPCHAF